MTKTVKLSKVQKKESTTDSKNIGNVKAKVAKQRDVMYIYPDGEDKKKFRAAARRKRDSFLKATANAENENAQKKLVREANSWAKGIYTKGNLPEFS